MGDSFDYSKIPVGYYDNILENSSNLRRYWHFHKFDTVSYAIKSDCAQSILDVGCFAGSFLGTLNQKEFPKQVGVDVLESQVEYANKKYGAEYRKFLYFNNITTEKLNLDTSFDVITCIEVIEHLSEDEIEKLFKNFEHLLRPGGKLVITTPNYFSVWPILEIILGLFSKVTYEEQHITKFTYWNFAKKLQQITSFKDCFSLKYTTTSHFLSWPFSMINFNLSIKLSRMIDQSKYKNPLGCLLIAVFERIK